MKRIFTVVVLAAATGLLMAGGTFPSDGDSWTEDANYAANWTYVEYGSTVYYVSDGDAKVGQNYARVSWVYQWILDHYTYTAKWPSAYIALPGAPINMSDPNTVISFWFKPDLTATTAGSFHNTMINMDFRLYTDPTGVYGSYKEKVVLYVPNNTWQYYTFKASDFFDGQDGTPDVSHVYGVLFMGANYEGDSVFSIDGLSISDGFPAFVMQSPAVDANSVFTTPGGIYSIELRWNMPVKFNSVGSVSVKDEQNNPIYCTVLGSGSDVMKIIFDVPLMYNKYTVTVSDSVKSFNTGRAIDGNGDGMPGGDGVFVIEHRKAEDINKDNQAELKDLKILANQWLEQF